MYLRLNINAVLLYCLVLFLLRDDDIYQSIVIMMEFVMIEHFNTEL
jgi:hypothetical protein